MRAQHALVVALSLAIPGCTKNSNPTPSPSCTYTVAPASQGVGASGTFTATVTTQGGCVWTAASDQTWLTIASGASGTGSGAITYTVSSAGASGGTAHITVQWTGGTAQVVVTQTLPPPPQTACYTVAPATQPVPTAGGTFSAVVTATASNCPPWTSSPDVSWLGITSGGSGATSGTIGFAAAANTDVERSGHIVVQWATGTAPIAINQAGIGCVYTLTPSSQAVSAAGGGGFSFTVTRNTASGCSWSASTSTPWITLTGPTTGLSPGTVGFAVAPNSRPARAGSINIVWSGGNADFTVTQAAGM